MGRAGFLHSSRSHLSTESPIAIAVIGPNGSGKSSAISELMADSDSLLSGLPDESLSSRIAHIIHRAIVNPDEIAKRIRLEHSDWSQDKIDKTAQTQSDEIRRTLAKGRIDFAFETVGSHPSKVDFLYELKEMGYFVAMIFIGTEGPEINKRRVRERVLRGGHPVNEKKIASRWNRTMSLLSQYLSAVDFAVVYDNSIDATHRGDKSARLLAVKKLDTLILTDDFFQVSWVQRFIPTP